MIFNSRTRRPGLSNSGNHHSESLKTTDDSEFDLEQILKPIDRWIGRHPAISIGIAIAAGVTIGCFVKRR